MILNEESLRDPLVHHDHSYIWFCGRLVIKQVDSSFKLGNLTSKHLITLGITHTVSVDDDISWELVLVVNRESPDSLTDRLLHVVLHDLLALPLNQIITVVLTHLLVDGSREANDRLGSCMTHINADQHGSLLLHSLWKLHVVEVTTSLGVYLSKDVGRFRQIKLHSVAHGYYLGWHPVLKHHLLKHLVVVLTLQNTDHHGWVINLLVLHHVAAESFVKLLTIRLLREFDPVRLFHS